jgi:hypothetical protein
MSKRKIVYGSSTITESKGIITIRQVRKIGKLRKQYIAERVLLTKDLDRDEIVALRGAEAYRYIRNDQLRDKDNEGGLPNSE